MKLEIFPIKAFNDNYIWIILNVESNNFYVVDPGDAQPVLDYMSRSGASLEGILITHHHADHTGGISKLLGTNAGAPVIGPDSPAIDQISIKVEAGDTLRVFDQDFKVMEIPGHTLDHIAFYCPDSATGFPLLFCGDTLFAGGCGRVFEGTYAMMHQSLSSLAALPSATRIYCAHEYTLANLDFAHAVSPSDPRLQERIKLEKHKRDSDLPTLPSTIETELSTNPFMRCADPSIIESASIHAGKQTSGETEVFSILRKWKDSF